MNQTLVKKAKEFAYKMHEGQKRKGGMPYITHPEGVVKILEQIILKEGLNDKEVILSVAWLHDLLEDTAITYECLREGFGKDIADKVYLLSRNVCEEEYKTRIKNSDSIVKLVKLADTLHNIHDPYLMSYLSDNGIKKKIDDCKEFYIPLAMQVCPSIGFKLKDSIDAFLKIFRRYEK
ncbi:MAG: HD domain-containing protein [Nanoarchaeota archaeon]|nr:HD domain-containing protein [Nanoarchaeota archaeon]